GSVRLVQADQKDGRTTKLKAEAHARHRFDESRRWGPGRQGAIPLIPDRTPCMRREEIAARPPEKPRRLTFSRTVLALTRVIAWGLADPSSHATALVARPLFHSASETRKQRSTSST